MPSWLAQHESLTLDPDAALWRCRTFPPAGSDGTDAILRFRRQLALPADRPIVMSGHQAGFWHAGIAAKVFALSAAARRFDAASAWVVVDQDTGDPARVHYPVARADNAIAEPRLARTVLDLLPPAAPGTTTGRQPASRPRPIEPDKGTSPTIAAALVRMSSSLADHAAAPSRAMQVSHAALDLLGPRSPDAARIHLISALAIANTNLFRTLVDRMRAGPAACTTHYNAAVAAHPRARMRQLAASTRRGPELPLWIITPAGTREPAYAADLDADSPASQTAAVPILAPRALTMTALLRWAACDLFIHGLGGGRYDAIMESWLASWLGITNLAPAVVVSATRLLPLVDDPPPTPDEVARAVWAAHHARHDPGLAPALLNDGRRAAATSAKQRRIAAIAAASDTDRLSQFRALHDWVDQERTARTAELAALDARAATLRARSRDSTIVFDRTWPAPLIPDPTLASLHAEINHRLPS